MFKRAHYAALGTVLVLLVTLFNLPSGAAARLKLAVGAVFLPLFGLSGSAGSFVDQASYRLLPRSALIERVSSLERENQELRLKAAQGEAALAENARLVSQLGAMPRGPWKPRLARVVGRDATTWWRTIRIDLGSRGGAAVNLPVVTADGLVGRISSVGLHHSEVALVGDATCGVAAMIAETRDHGVIKGAQSTLEAGVVEWTSLRHSPEVMAGHQLFTSGLGGIFPKGLTIGKVIDTREVDAGLYTAARVRLAANLNRLEEVWVLQP